MPCGSTAQDSFPQGTDVKSLYGKGSMIVACVFVLGFFLGRIRAVGELLAGLHLELWVLYALLFIVGIGIGANTGAFGVMKKMHARIMLVPIAVIAGTLLGSGIATLFLPGITLLQGLAVGAGFGYYSLSSVIISKIEGETLGLIALVSNLIREIITLFLSGPIARLFGPLAPIAAGGATAMDTSLPVITRASGSTYAVVAVFSGMVLTLLVPFVIPLLLKF
jgi:uncharacterized membrane protein YbjE (DUF340 family)